MFWIWLESPHWSDSNHIQNTYFFKVLDTIFLHNLWLILTCEAKVSLNQIVIITNFVVISSVGIKRFVCNKHLALCVTSGNKAIK